MAIFRRNSPSIGTARPDATGPAAATPAVDTASTEPSSPRPTLSDKGPDMTTKPTIPSSPTGNSPGVAGASNASSAQNAFKPEIPRRVVEIPGAPPRRAPDAGSSTGGFTATTAAASAPSVSSTEMRKLIVGREISLSGEITACDVLVVEGTVEAKLRDGRAIEITESGLFKGSVEIDEADIGGRFEGDLLVRGRLKIRSTGRIHGAIKYGELEVEAGGQMVGDVQVIQAAPVAVAKIAPPASASSGNEALARSSAE
ncbi:MAG TPA: polymer-forming cytoskeletal protein [Azospirillaceae bacterium]|nr:polymer-forming cytoskeletal protein [Azospirillaceae bacterium]